MNNTLKFALAATVGFTVVLAVTPDAHAATTIRSQALSTAKAHRGDPYQWGAAGPHKFDCSGLTYYSYKVHGKTLPRTAQQQYNHSTHVSPANRKVGDLIFIRTRSGVFHVGIYSGFHNGHGWMWDAPKPGRTVGEHQIRWYTAGPSVWAVYGRVGG